MSLTDPKETAEPEKTADEGTHASEASRGEQEVIQAKVLGKDQPTQEHTEDYPEDEDYLLGIEGSDEDYDDKEEDWEGNPNNPHFESIIKNIIKGGRIWCPSSR